MGNWLKGKNETRGAKQIPSGLVGGNLILIGLSSTYLSNLLVGPERYMTCSIIRSRDDRMENEKKKSGLCGTQYF